VLLEVRREAGEADWRPVSGAEPFDWDAPLPLAARSASSSRRARRSFAGVARRSRKRSSTRRRSRFGLRACDLTAIAYQDRFFAGDPAYARRRERALLVGLNCLAACAGGFCLDVDAGPFAHAGFDLNLTPLGDGRVAIEVGTARGQEALASARLATRALDGAALEAAERRARESFSPRPFIARAIERLNAHTIADDEWQALGPACLACTGCTSLCPTCSCFTVVDEVRTAAASGPGSGTAVSSKASSARRRAIIRRRGPAIACGASGTTSSPPTSWRSSAGGCVGCGRCDVTCPGSIGALRVLGALGSR
jgi:formate hydrogenlyase subunit 6/NADH:ubiquinone oxidoreductase subunit I